LNLICRFRFGSHCQPCPLHNQFTSAKQGRTLSYRQHHELLLTRQTAMQTDAFWLAMKARPPIEGILSLMVRTGARRARYLGSRKVNFQWVFTAFAINLKRWCSAWARHHHPSWAHVVSGAAV